MALLPSLQASYALMRLDKPIGTWLLLWPTFWALWLASGGLPAWEFLIIFSIGVFLMRSAGCVINDIADRNFDSLVKRTHMRPLACGATTPKQALVLFGLLLLLAASLLIFLNQASAYVAIIAVLLASFYPFVKRFSHFPQVVLGLAFSCPIPMAFTAISGTIPLDIIWLMAANVLWTVGYDTYYARVDQDDDIHIGIHSTSIIFGQYTQAFIFVCQTGMLTCLSIYGLLNERGMMFYMGLVACMITFGSQYRMTRDGERSSYLRAFLANNYSGLMVFIGIFLDLNITRL